MRPVPEPARTFAALLKQLRTSAGMTQEELAAAATLSYRSISDLERGINLTARGQTARLLADALSLKGAARARFEAAARGEPPAASRSPARAYPAGAFSAGGVAAATRTLPRDTGAFTGREPELRVLLAAAGGAARSGRVVGIHAIGGMAGVGKTTFAIHAAHQLAPKFPDGQVFLSLHAHTPGQRPVDPADALASLLLTAGIAPSQIPPGLDERVRLWRDHVAGRRLLLLLDDAGGHEQVRPLLPGTAGSLVLITSRKHLTALDDAQAISLDTLPDRQAAELLIRLANRQDLAADDSLVREIVRLCGYLPLAVGMLAKQLQHHPAWTAADLAGELTTARDRLELMQAENVSVSAAFDLSYQDLTLDSKQLFRRLGMHPGAEIDVYAAAALDGAELASTRRRLDILYDHYLLAELAAGRYRLHDLVREHARALAASDQDSDREAAIDRLIGYYVHVACAADQYLARRAPAQAPQPQAPRAAPPPAYAPALASRTDAIAWMDRERTNNHAISMLAAERHRPEAVMALAAATHAFLRFRGHWDQALAQDATALELAWQTRDQRAEATARTNLGDMLLAMRDYPAATAQLREALGLYLAWPDPDPLGEAGVRTELASAFYLAGDNRGAAADLARALELFRQLGDRRGEALVLSRLASVQLVTGDYGGAADGLTRALKLYRELGDRLGEAQALNDLGAVQHAMGDSDPASASLAQALAVYRELGDQLGVANALLDLAGVQQGTADRQAATAGLTTALDLYRDVGDRLGIANVLNLLGTIRQESGDLQAAARMLHDALDQYRDLGDPAGEAESLVNLGTVSLESGAVAEALGYFERARAIAGSVTSLPLTARALEGIGLGQVRQGRRAEGSAALAQALEIYQRIGSPGAERVQQALSGLDG
jgi:tetratricopeptide (TPR) repeat protein/DNA-binding XRE family transcriptional regulator